MTDPRIDALELKVRNLERLLQASVRKPGTDLKDMTLVPINQPGSPVNYALYDNNGNRAVASNVSAPPKILSLYVPGRGAIQFGEIIDPTLRSSLQTALGSIDNLIYARSDNSGSNYLMLGPANDSATATYTGGFVYNRPVGWFTRDGIFFMGCGIPTDIYETLGNGVNHGGTSTQISVICADQGAAAPRKLRLVKMTASNASGAVTFVQT